MTSKPLLTRGARRNSRRPIAPATTSKVQTAPPVDQRRRVDRLLGMRNEQRLRHAKLEHQLQQLTEYLALAPSVTEGLKLLSEKLFLQELKLVQEKLTFALQDVLEQPVAFRATPEFKNGTAIVEFSVERNGHSEDVQRGQGGSVQNILSVGLRMFALATLGKADHRGFLVLDEQDCWLRPELVPRLVKMVRSAGRELGFQVLMISHHDLGHFERYAERIFRLEPAGSTVQVRQLNTAPYEPDH